MRPVLPNTFGAEVYLVVEKDVLAPMRLELIGGGAFPMKYYASYVDCVQAAIHETVRVRQRGRTPLPWHEIIELASMRRASFARLLVVGAHATFLYFATGMAPVMRGQRVSLVQRDDREIDCFVDGDEVVCLDGWVCTEVSPADTILVALPGK
jgi:hypothetical protein